MNNNSPNSLGDYIRIENADLAAIGIAELEGSHYATESSIVSFMEGNNITDRGMLMEALTKFNNTKEITILDESTSEASLIDLREFMMILESLNPFEVVKVAKGRTLLRSLGKQIGSFVSGKEYDQQADLEGMIEDCNRMLEDIAKEKRRASSGKDTDQLKFSGMYIFNIAKSLFVILCVPLMLSEKKIKLPIALTKVFVKDGKKAAATEVVKHSGKIRKVAGAAFTGFDIATSLPPDVKGLYLSFKDYNELLTLYETQIRSIRNDLKRQCGKLERNKEIKGMVEFTEDVTPNDAVNVHYQAPGELQVKNDRTPDVVHDDGNSAGQMEAPKPEVDNVPSAPIVNPQEPVEPEEIAPAEPQLDKPESNPPAEFSPLDAINQAKKDPLNVPIAKYGDLYYVDHNDLRCYMDACGSKKYESALNNIIAAHNDPEFCAESVRVVMRENELSNLDPSIKLEMESSEVEFQIYK